MRYLRFAGALCILTVAQIWPGPAAAFGVYQGYWCDYGGSCYSDSGSSSSGGGGSSCSGSGPCIPMLFCLIPGVCEGWYGKKESEPAPPPAVVTVHRVTEADRVSRKTKADAIRSVMADLKRPAKAAVTGTTVAIANDQDTPIFGHRNSPFSGFNPTSHTSGTSSSFKGLKRAVAILALSNSPDSPAADVSFFGSQAAAALSGEALRVDLVEPDTAISVPSNAVANLDFGIALHSETVANYEAARRERERLGKALEIEMKAIAEDLPPACFIEGMCQSPEALERKRQVDALYMAYRGALRGESAAFRAKEESARALARQTKKSVRVKIVGAGGDD